MKENLQLPAMETFKQEAKKLAKTTGLLHAAALDKKAQEYGYKNYKTLKPKLRTEKKGVFGSNSRLGTLFKSKVEYGQQRVVVIEGAMRSGKTKTIIENQCLFDHNDVAIVDTIARKPLNSEYFGEELVRKACRENGSKYIEPAFKKARIVTENQTDFLVGLKGDQSYSTIIIDDIWALFGDKKDGGRFILDIVLQNPDKEFLLITQDVGLIYRSADAHKSNMSITIYEVMATLVGFKPAKTIGQILDDL